MLRDFWRNIAKPGKNYAIVFFSPEDSTRRDTNDSIAETTANTKAVTVRGKDALHTMVDEL